MLVFPIVNNRHVMNVEIRLKNVEKIRQGVRFKDAPESEIVVNSEKYTNSSYFNSNDDTREIDFIRSKSILYPRSFFVTTNNMRDRELYDVYVVAQPPKKVNTSLDKLYSRAITDLRCETPGITDRGRYVSFQDLGIGDNITNEKLNKLKDIITHVRDSNEWPRLFEREGIADLEETLDFLKNFECTIISDSIIPEESLQDTIKSFSVIKTRDFKNLNKYYKMAKSNTEIYTKMSYAHQVLYNKPFALIQSPKKTRQFVKKKEDNQYVQAS